MQFVFEWNRIDLPQRFRRKAKRKVRAQAWFRIGGAHGERRKFLQRKESRKKLIWLQQREVLEVPQSGNLGKWGTPWLHEKLWKKRWEIKSRCRGCWCLQTLALLILYLFLGFDPGNGLNRTSSESFKKFTTSVFLPQNKNPVSKLAHAYVLPPVSKMHVLKSAEWYIEQRSKTTSRHFAGSC